MPVTRVQSLNSTAAVAGLSGHPRTVRQPERGAGVLVVQRGVAVERVVYVEADAEQLAGEPDVRKAKSRSTYDYGCWLLQSL